MLLTCPDEPPAGIAKRTKAFLTQIKMPLKVVFLAADGAVFDDDGEDEGEDDGEAGGAAEVAPEKTAEGTAAAAATSPDQAAVWAKVEASISPLVQAMADRGAEKAAQVQSAWNGAMAAAAAGKFAAATAVAVKLKPVLSAMAAAAPPAPQAPAPQATDPQAARWAAVQAAIAPLYEQALALAPENAGKLRAAWAMALEKADGADFATALTVAARLKPALEAALAAGPAKPAVPAGTVAFQKSRVLWVSARSKMMAEVQKLADAINASAEADDMADEIRAAGAEIVAEVAQIDTRLQDALDALTNADEPQRAALKTKAAGILAEYQSLLGKGIFTRIDDNPFTPVSVASGARNALNAIARTLAG